MTRFIPSIAPQGVLSSEKVRDLALQIVWNTFMNMLSARPDIHSEMVRQGTLFGVLAESQVLTNMPEYQDLYTQFPGTDWNQRACGLGATGFIPLTSTQSNLRRQMKDETGYGCYADWQTAVREVRHPWLRRNMGYGCRRKIGTNWSG